MKRYFLSSLVGLSLISAAVAQSVTVGTMGADYATLTDAVVAVGSDSATPNVITFIDNGPFIEFNRIIINVARTGPDDLVIQGAPGIRPVIITDMTASLSKVSAIHLRKQGNLTIKDLVIIPPADGVTPDNYTAMVAETGIEIIVDNLAGTSITLENILISSNNGSNQPTAAVDGLTPPVMTPNTVSFRDEGIIVQSQTGGAQLHHLTMNGVVVSGIAGDQGSDGVRGFPDGTPGSEWIIGPGSVFSYNGGHGFQPGGTEGLEVKILGSQDNPVKLINNQLSGINVTNQAGAAFGPTEVEWCIIANNGQHGINNADVDTALALTNVTIANNGGVALLGPASPDAVAYTFDGVIAAGDGGADADNVIRLIASGGGTINPSTLTANNSAIVTEGPYALNSAVTGGDGIESDSNYTVTLNSVISADPQFASLDPVNAGFAVVTNPAYGTAGPGGSPLVGGGDYAPASVEDWQLF